jgi:hypothetical protein
VEGWKGGGLDALGAGEALEAWEAGRLGGWEAVWRIDDDLQPRVLSLERERQRG